VTFLRFLKVLSLGLWVGSIFFFAAVVAPAAFGVLPTHYLAGLVVSRSLGHLHWLGMACGLVFLLSSVLIALFAGGPNPFRKSDLLIVAMIGITLLTHYTVEKKMLQLRESMGVIDTVARDDPRRVQFNRLHKFSTGMEESVFVCGLVLMYMMAKHQDEPRY
jgi:uncharacterized membrane protein